MQIVRAAFPLLICSMAALLIAGGCGRPRAAKTGEAKRASSARPAPATPGVSSTPTDLPHQPGIAQPPNLVGPETRLLQESWYGDLDGIRERRFLRVLVAPSKLGFYFDGLEIHGAIHDLTREFERFLNRKFHTGNLTINIVFIPVARERLLPLLAEGKGDLVASLVGVRETRGAVTFSDPLYDHAKAIIVSGPGTPPVSRWEDLAGKEIYFHKNTIPYENLKKRNESLQKSGKPLIQLTAANEALQPEDLLEMVNAGLVPMTIGEDRLLQFWVKVLPHLDLHPDLIVAEGPMAWAMQPNTPKLSAVVNEFVREHKVGTAYGNTVVRKYLSDIDWVKGATSGGNLERFRQLETLFHKYGSLYRFPYLLLAAQGFQESKLNPNLRSPAGAIGVMQIKPSTAAASPIQIPDVQKTDRNIEAGAKYLRYLVTQYFTHEPKDRVVKGLFAIASYNAGPGRIQELRNKAAAEGYDPNRWFNNVEIVASREIGRETVEYVSNIFKYYLAYTMVVERDARSKAARSKFLSGRAPGRQAEDRR